jgi:succinate dehydrogenase / fumarate reductase iron-sulfur subunit
MATSARLDNLENPRRLFRCRTILNRPDICPKNLNPVDAIGQVRSMFARRTV